MHEEFIGGRKKELAVPLARRSDRGLSGGDSIVNGHDFDCLAYFWQYLKSSSKGPELQENHNPKQQPPAEELRPSAAFQPNETVDRCSLRILSPYVSSMQAYAPPLLLDKYAQPRDQNPSRKKDPINSWLRDVLICSCTTRILM